MLFRYMDNEGQLHSQFLDLVSVADGKAATIVAAIKDVLHKNKVPTERLFGLGTDGAAVMTGMRHNMSKWNYCKWVFIFTACFSCSDTDHEMVSACLDSIIFIFL